jgi:hypothetical protein
MAGFASLPWKLLDGATVMMTFRSAMKNLRWRLNEGHVHIAGA